MPSFNQVVIAGVLGRDPEVRYTPGGTAVCDLSVAVSRQWFDKQSNQKKEDTCWVSVTLWGRTAEIAGEYLAKGRPVLIGGYLKEDTWEDRETGQKRSRLKVVGEILQLLGGGRGQDDQRPAHNPSGYGEESQESPTPAAGTVDDSIPF